MDLESSLLLTQMPSTGQWLDLPAELQCQVLDLLIAASTVDGTAAADTFLAPLATVCRRWQLYLEPHTFRCVRTTPGQLARGAFQRVFKGGENDNNRQRRAYVQRVAVELPFARFRENLDFPWGGADAMDRVQSRIFLQAHGRRPFRPGPPSDEPVRREQHENDTMFTLALYRFLQEVSTWLPDEVSPRGIALEIAGGEQSWWQENGRRLRRFGVRLWRPEPWLVRLFCPYPRRPRPLVPPEWAGAVAGAEEDFGFCLSWDFTAAAAQRLGVRSVWQIPRNEVVSSIHATTVRFVDPAALAQLAQLCSGVRRLAWEPRARVSDGGRAAWLGRVNEGLALVAMMTEVRHLFLHQHSSPAGPVVSETHLAERLAAMMVAGGQLETLSVTGIVDGRDVLGAAVREQRVFANLEALALTTRCLVRGGPAADEVFRLAADAVLLMPRLRLLVLHGDAPLDYGVGRVVLLYQVLGKGGVGGGGARLRVLSSNDRGAPSRLSAETAQAWTRVRSGGVELDVPGALTGRNELTETVLAVLREGMGMPSREERTRYGFIDLEPDDDDDDGDDLEQGIMPSLDQCLGLMGIFGVFWWLGMVEIGALLVLLQMFVVFYFSMLIYCEIAGLLL